jgi:hypothetical protein
MLVNPIPKFLSTMLFPLFMLLSLSLIVYLHLYLHYKFPNFMAFINNHTLSHFFIFLHQKILSCMDDSSTDSEFTNLAQGVKISYTEIPASDGGANSDDEQSINPSTYDAVSGVPSIGHPSIVNAVLMMLYFTYQQTE